MSTKFKVETSKGEVNLSSSDLMEILLSKVLADYAPERRGMSETLCYKLQSTRVLDRTSPLELAHISFLAGFYYAGFMEKNNVSFEQQTASEPTEVHGLKS
jgi:hypothetical protein